ncbi:MAG: hypothetical protein H6R26_997 [Proteobacteria bacterium]|nr:hypothetical protein [Pseudomonadota bacterium]
MSKIHRVPSALAPLVMGVLLAIPPAESALAANAPRDPTNGRQSYSGSNMSCLVANDFYAVHFTAIQPGMNKDEKTPFVKYCQEIPSVGKTYLSIDLLDRDVRNTPIALRVVEEEVGIDGVPPKEKSTLAELPARIYKNGTVDTHVEITTPGHYALIATIGDDMITDDDRLRIPFSVGIPSPSKPSNWMGKFTGVLTAGFFGVMGLIGLRTYLSYRRPKRAPADAQEPGLRYPPAG